MQTHELKTLLEYFQAVVDGKKIFEVRLNDRDFKVGDCVILREFDATTNQYTGRVSFKYQITYILENFVGLQPGYVVFGILWSWK